MPNTYDEDINNIIADFSFFENWEDKYQYLIDLGRSVPQMDVSLKVNENKLKGCQSVVYFTSFENDNGTLKFLANSDAAIVQGLVALLLKVYSDRFPREIIEINVSFINRIGLDEHLSPTRKNGLSSMINSIQNMAQSRLK